MPLKLTTLIRIFSLNASKRSLETLKGLCGYANQVDNNNPSTSLLNNLCTGLEKFLGHSNGNYTGDGIVYSDLDRLCDGVMSLLHGVLGGVQDDDAVKKYDDNLSGSKLDDVLNSLEVSIGKGSAQFGDQVGKVSGWLGRYGDEVKEKNSFVTGPFSVLKGDIDDHIKNIDSLNVLPISDILEKWKDRAQWYINHVNTSQEALKNIDPSLSGKLTPHVKMLLQATTTFKEAAGNDDLKEVYEMARERMEKVSEFLTEATRDRMHEVQRYLKKWIGALSNRLEKLRTKQFDDLFSSVNYGLQDAFAKVNDGIQAIVKRYGSQVVGELKTLVQQSNEFNEKFPKTKNALQTAIHEVESDINKLKDLSNIGGLKGANGRTVSVIFLKAIAGKGKPFEPLEAYFNKVDTDVMEPLKTVMYRIGEGIRRGVQQVKEDVLKEELNKTKSELSKLQTFANGDVSDFKQLQEKLQKILGNEFEAKDLDLKRHVTSIKTVVDKLDGTSQPQQNVTKPDTINLLNSLAAIPQIVSDHSKDVVQKVMEKIAEKVKGELTNVVQSVSVKLENISNCVNNKSDLDVAYSTNRYAKGLAKLVTDFEEGIDRELKTLQGVVGTTSPDEQGTVYAQLKQLKADVTQLGTKVEDVQKKTTDAEHELNGCIHNANTLLVDAMEETANVFNRLRNAANSKITSAFTGLQSKAKSLYTNRKTKEVEALQKIVEGELEEIEKTIDEDKKRGAKKFLSTLKEKFVDPHNSFFPPASLSGVSQPTEKKSLQSYSGTLIHWFSELYEGFYGQRDIKIVHSKVDPSRSALHHLLTDLATSKHFDHNFTDNLTNLQKTLNDFAPKKFHTPNSILLDALKSGMDKFTEQLGNAYVNRYSGKTFGSLLEKKASDTEPIKQVTVLSTEGRNCAKVCLTILEGLSEDLAYLKEKCNTTYGPWKHNKICENDEKRTNKLGCFFQKRGFTIPLNDGVKQDGQLRCSVNMKGGHICQKLDEEISNAKDDEHLKACNATKENEIKFNVIGILDCLLSHLHQYYKVGHISSFAAKKSPCSVYEMLTWCCGLEYNSAYEKLKQRCQKLCDDEKDSHLKTILSKVAKHGLPYLSSNSRNILTAILGTGDEHTVYASDFSNNYLNLSYPSSGEACLDTLLDILRRMFPVCRFLQSRCNSLSSDFGWAGCQYGKQVKHANWQCDKHIADKESDCVPRSPLMSYFTDSLPGHLPHQLSSIGCTATCNTCPKSTPGQPCLTPLGFRGFSGSTRRGKELCNVLTKMLDDADLRSLFCLKPKTPASLPEHFGFVLSLVKDWADSKNTYKNPMEKEFEKSIKSQSIDLYKKADELTGALRDAYRSRHYNYADNSHRPLYDDLSSLSMTSSCSDPIKNTLCAPYLSSLSCDSNYYLALKHCNTYLSWAIYLPWTFWDLLNNLYNAFCGITCADWGCCGCLRGDTCRSGKHGVVEDDKKDVTCECDSIVSCRGVAPTLYQYGFSFGEASTLNGGSTAKKCKDFCTQLKNVLDSEYFKELFKECDEFLWIIRTPFSYLLLALWSLSLLYLLHIAVVRLDVLRIRSHLKSPSSHRIAAQSLLAAARVKALANVKYFSP
ncbi:hypothetical protein, conserved [Babesia ovata]|uniref:C3H1-type domain-containing protein n=1 Tax=Babesia ovata TaxID=189622 RepID=A0A2H6KJJ0_9APIC|nr:uncharacterized protein BOVATA_046490 [Babesia ovata]GBE63156.1 hypothetical protein, conserved [Babesia ovata]